LSGQKLNLQFSNEEDQKSFYYDIDYITKKAHSYFGKKLQFVADKELSDQTLPTTKNNSNKHQAGEQQSTGDEFTDMIVNELGGEEIS
jgi:hypothetical protein